MPKLTLRGTLWMAVFAVATVQAASVGPGVSTTDEFGAPIRDACRAHAVSGGGLTCSPARPAHSATKVPSAQTVPVAHPAVPVRRSIVSDGDTYHAGHYLVIGSFSERNNAAAWADRNVEFAPEIIFTQESATPSYRVLVGPLAAGTVPMMRAVLEAAGITSPWPLTLCQSGGDLRLSCDRLTARDSAVAVNWRPRPATR